MSSEAEVINVQKTEDNGFKERCVIQSMEFYNWYNQNTSFEMAGDYNTDNSPWGRVINFIGMKSKNTPGKNGLKKICPNSASLINFLKNKLGQDGSRIFTLTEEEDYGVFDEKASAIQDIVRSAFYYSFVGGDEKYFPALLNYLNKNYKCIDCYIQENEISENSFIFMEEVMDFILNLPDRYGINQECINEAALLMAETNNEKAFDYLVRKRIGQRPDFATVEEIFNTYKQNEQSQIKDTCKKIILNEEKSKEMARSSAAKNQHIEVHQYAEKFETKRLLNSYVAEKLELHRINVLDFENVKSMIFGSLPLIVANEYLADRIRRFLLQKFKESIPLKIKTAEVVTFVHYCYQGKFLIWLRAFLEECVFAYTSESFSESCLPGVQERLYTSLRFLGDERINVFFKESESRLLLLKYLDKFYFKPSKPEQIQFVASQLFERGVTDKIQEEDLACEIDEVLNAVRRQYNVEQDEDIKSRTKVIREYLCEGYQTYLLPEIINVSKSQIQNVSPTEFCANRVWISMV